jgi:hypothetical protein
MEYTMDVIKHKKWLLMNISMLGESFSSCHGKASHVLWLQMEEMASRYGG